MMMIDDDDDDSSSSPFIRLMIHHSILETGKSWNSSFVVLRFQIQIHTKRRQPI
jgi:hypothetical protein